MLSNPKHLHELTSGTKINDKNDKEYSGGTAVNVGNPHIIFFVNEINNFDIKKLGPNIMIYE